MHISKVHSIQCTLIFAIGIVASFIGYFKPGSQFLGGFLIVIPITYLIAGWYFFKGYHPEGRTLLLFIMGYLYSSIFVAFTLAAAEWPMAKTFLSIAPVWVTAQLVIVIMIRKKLTRESLVQFLIESGLMLLLIILFLLKA